jgi:hypothetical protein
MLMAALGVVFAFLAGANSYYGTRRLGDGTNLLGTQFSGLRAHMEADMMHDAVRADVLTAMHAGRSKDAAALAAAHKEFAEHSKSLRDNVASVEALELGGEVRRSVALVKPELQAYIASAGNLLHTAERDADAADQAYPEFETRYTALEDKMGTLSTLLNTGHRQRTANLEAMVAFFKTDDGQTRAPHSSRAITATHSQEGERQSRTRIRSKFNKGAAANDDGFPKAAGFSKF